MVLIGNTLVSLEVIERKFVCNLSRCKGMCCVDGVAGAPVEQQEGEIMARIIPALKPYLRRAGWEVIKDQGPVVKDHEGDLVTPLVATEECAYAVFEEGVAKCAIEQAWFDGKVAFRKPISCHLYPIRLNPVDNLEALNYHQWHICKPALRKGKKEGIPIFCFVKDALIRRYGEQWYRELEETAEAYYKKQKSG
jgi:hypothetical protein